MNALEKFLDYQGEDLSEGFPWNPNILGFPTRHQVLNLMVFELKETKDIDKVSWLVSRLDKKYDFSHLGAVSQIYCFLLCILFQDQRV